MDAARLTRRTLLGGLAASAILPAPALALQSAQDVREVRVPFDHANPQDGSFPLGYALLGGFDPSRRTVFVLADGQQFFLSSPVSFAQSAGRIFDDRFNVVGVLARADAEAVQARVGSGDAVDWRQAYRLLRADQWLGDIEAVRQALLGPEGLIGLYGRSGGGLLVHQYMVRHGSKVESVFTQAAVNAYLAAQYGLLSDHFWAELADQDRTRLTALIASERYPRERIAALFQRQNFFVARDDLASERRSLIAELEGQDVTAIEKRENEYQINAIAALQDSARGPAITVRLFEFYAPIAQAFPPRADILQPDLENSAVFASPLMKLLGSGAIDAPTMDFGPLHSRNAQVTLLAGRWDHTCDYRTQIALAASYPKSRLLLLDDDHVFSRLSASGHTPELVQASLQGWATPAFARVMAEIEPLRFDEAAPA